MKRYIKAEDTGKLDSCLELIQKYVENNAGFDITWIQWDSSARGGHGSYDLSVGRSGYNDAVFSIDIDELREKLSYDGSYEAAEYFGKNIITQLSNYAWEEYVEDTDDEIVEQNIKRLEDSLDKIFAPDGIIHYAALFDLSGSLLQSSIDKLTSLGKSNELNKIFRDHGTSLAELEDLKSDVFPVNPIKFMIDNDIVGMSGAGKTWYAFKDTGDLVPDMKQNLADSARRYDDSVAFNGYKTYDFAEKIIDALNNYDFRLAEGTYDPYSEDISAGLERLQQLKKSDEYYMG